MRIHFLSDLHNEFSQFTLPDTNAHVIVLGGDIDVGVNGIEWAKTLGKPVIYVGGNHESFRRQISDNIQNMRAAAAGSDVHFLERNEVILHGVRFLGCTLWTDFNLFGEEMADAAMSAAEQHINDYNVITHGSAPLSPATTRQWHKESVQWLERKLARPFSGKTVVVTHHGPHPRCVHPRYTRDILSASFSSNLEHLMGKADLWLFGHSHMSTDVKINGTRILSNPRGYSWFDHGSENAHFVPSMVISVANSIRTFGDDHLASSADIHAQLKALPITSIAVRQPDGKESTESGILVEDFPDALHASLYRMATRQGLRQNLHGQAFVDLTAWREILWKTDPHA